MHGYQPGALEKYSYIIYFVIKTLITNILSSGNLRACDEGMYNLISVDRYVYIY